MLIVPPVRNVISHSKLSDRADRADGDRVVREIISFCSDLQHPLECGTERSFGVFLAFDAWCSYWQYYLARFRQLAFD